MSECLSQCMLNLRVNTQIIILMRSRFFLSVSLKGRQFEFYIKKKGLAHMRLPDMRGANRAATTDVGGGLYFQQARPYFVGTLTKTFITRFLPNFIYMYMVCFHQTLTQV